MKTSYYVIAAAGLAAALVYNLWPDRRESSPIPTLPVPSESARMEPGTLPPLPTIPKATFPDINPPPDTALVIPATAPPASSTTDQSPSLLQIPTIPQPGAPSDPLTGQPVIPVVPVVPTIPSANASLAAPGPPVPVSVALAPPEVNLPPVNFTPHGKYVVLRGKNLETVPEKKLLGELLASKLIAIEGIGSVNKTEVVVQLGTLVRNIPKAEVLYVGVTQNDVYHFMRDRVPANDEIARLTVAKWCMFNGMREQALTEARAVLQFKPQSRFAADLARSLEESLKQFPTDGTAPAVNPPVVKPVGLSTGDTSVTPEAAITFGTRIQPILANLCVDCHARSDYDGPFKLARVASWEPGPQTTQGNLRVTAEQLNKTDPKNSPLLTKSLTAHGGLKRPPFVSRQTEGYRTLELWCVMAVGSNSSQGIANPTSGSAPASPVLPPVESSNSPTSPAIPPVVSVPAVPTVLPTPSTMKPTVPSQPPVLPAADPAPMSTGLPSIPVPPAQQSATVPSIPSVPALPPGAAPGQFGATKPPVPYGRDEFDPGNFNQGAPRR